MVKNQLDISAKKIYDGNKFYFKGGNILMKNIFKKFLIILITFSIILSINIVSKAENELVENNLETDGTVAEEVTEGNDNLAEEPEEEIYVLEEEEPVEETNFLEEEEILEEEDSSTTTIEPENNFFSFSSNDVTLASYVTGDVFIWTSGTVKIDSATIVGNAFIFASNIEISEYAQIYSSLFTFSENLTINGSINGNVYAIAQNFTFGPTAYIDLDLFLTSEKVAFEGSVYRDVNLSCEEFTISETSFIEGDLNYSCREEVAIPEDVVFGEVHYSDFTTNKTKTFTDKIPNWIYSTLAFIIFVIVLFVIGKAIHCKFMNTYTDFVSLLPKYLLYGILGLIVTPMVCILLFILGITAPLALILLAIYFIFILIASASIILTLAMLLADKLKEKITINDTARTILCILVLCIIYKLLRLIPIVGFIISLIVGILGFGLLVRSTWQKNEPIS